MSETPTKSPRLNQAPAVSRQSTDLYLATVLRRRPLWTLGAVQVFLDLDPYGAESRIQDGRIAWAFDLGAPKKRKRMNIRLLGHCAVELAHGVSRMIGPTKDLTLARVIELVLPHHRPELRGTDLQRAFSCGVDLIADLARAREIATATGGRPSSGPNSSPRFTRQSVVGFLERRRIT